VLGALGALVEPASFDGVEGAEVEGEVGGAGPSLPPVDFFE
jgi:hypothetical protein